MEETGSPFLVALVGFFSMAPLLVFGAFGGVLADRFDRKRLLLTSQFVNLAASVVILFVIAADAVVFWHAYVVVLAIGMGWAIDMPSRRSLVLDLIGGGGVTNAMALDSVGMHASRMAGPVTAGALIAAVGLTGGLIAVISLYIGAIICMKLIRVPPRAESSRPAVGFTRNLIQGFAYVTTNRIILATVIITVLMNLLLFPYMQMVPLIAKETLGVGPGLMGLLMGADGLGAIFGSIFIASAGRLRYHGRIYVGGSLIGLIMVLMFAGSQWFTVSFPILVLAGVGTAGFGTMQATIIVISSREEMRGRALGVISLAIGAGPIGALLIGALAEQTSPATAIMVFATLGLVALATIALWMSEIRGQMGPFADRQELEIPQPVAQRT